ncbi:MAG: ribbon-helix-helix domain-containing protein, partial [Eubacterium sp.]|nr:ribbon-helix-helix domain-containing protein [Eubacterium sp.]
MADGGIYTAGASPCYTNICRQINSCCYGNSITFANKKLNVFLIKFFINNLLKILLYFMLLIITYIYNRSQATILAERIIKKEKLVISKKSLRGDDGYKTFSVRIIDETVNTLDELSNTTNRSRNELINNLLNYEIKNCEVEA